MGKTPKKEIAAQNKGKPTVYNPEEHERLAQEAMAAPNKPEKEKKEKTQEKPAETANSGEPEAEEPKTEKQAPSEPEPPQTEWDGKINKYGFVRVSAGMLEALGWGSGFGKKKGKDIPIVLTVNPDDSVTFRRKQA